ncbi:MAG: flagellar basal body rod protein [Sporolactobacillus sp.]
MKKFLLAMLAFICAVVLLFHVGAMAVLLISLAILYFAFKQFVRASGGYKVLWATIGIVALCFSLGNIPSLIGLAALAGLYFVWHSWNKKAAVHPTSDDPFDNFEKEWNDMRY